MKTTTSRMSRKPSAALVVSGCLLLLNCLTVRAADEDRLCTAAQSGDLRALTVLVTADTNLVHARDRYGRLPLSYAAEAGHTEAVAYLLAQGSDIANRDNRGWTALHHAVFNDRTTVSSLLIQRGAAVDAPNSLNWTPLHLAVFKKNKTIVGALITAGADVFAKTSRDLTPYNLALVSGRRDIVDSLVASMGNVGHRARQPLLLAGGAQGEEAH